MRSLYAVSILSWLFFPGFSSGGVVVGVGGQWAQFKPRNCAALANDESDRNVTPPNECGIDDFESKQENASILVMCVKSTMFHLLVREELSPQNSIAHLHQNIQRLQREHCMSVSSAVSFVKKRVPQFAGFWSSFGHPFESSEVGLKQFDFQKTEAGWQDHFFGQSKTPSSVTHRVKSLKLMNLLIAILLVLVVVAKVVKSISQSGPTTDVARQASESGGNVLSRNILEMKNTKSCQAVQKLYRKGSRQHHPDKVDGSIPDFLQWSKVYDEAKATCTRETNTKKADTPKTTTKKPDTRKKSSSHDALPSPGEIVAGLALLAATPWLVWLETDEQRLAWREIEEDLEKLLEEKGGRRLRQLSKRHH
jgi:hypothetical protein